jgi:hypothetical protein
VIRPLKVIANALSAGFHVIAHRAQNMLQHSCFPAEPTPLISRGMSFHYVGGDGRGV